MITDYPVHLTPFKVAGTIKATAPGKDFFAVLSDENQIMVSAETPATLGAGYVDYVKRLILNDAAAFRNLSYECPHKQILTGKSLFKVELLREHPEYKNQFELAMIGRLEARVNSGSE